MWKLSSAAYISQRNRRQGHQLRVRIGEKVCEVWGQKTKYEMFGFLGKGQVNGLGKCSVVARAHWRASWRFVVMNLKWFGEGKRRVGICQMRTIMMKGMSWRWCMEVIIIIETGWEVELGRGFGEVQCKGSRLNELWILVKLKDYWSWDIIKEMEILWRSCSYWGWQYLGCDPGNEDHGGVRVQDDYRRRYQGIEGPEYWTDHLCGYEITKNYDRSCVKQW